MCVDSLHQYFSFKTGKSVVFGMDQTEHKVMELHYNLMGLVVIIISLKRCLYLITLCTGGGGGIYLFVAYIPSKECVGWVSCLICKTHYGWGR